MDEDFMTTKEKDYVNYIFTKNLKQFKTDINYKQIFNDLKEEFTPFKVETKSSFTFGKDTCRDNKKNRYFTSTENIPEDLKIRCEIDDLITKLSFRKYFTNDVKIEYDIAKFIQFESVWQLLHLSFMHVPDKKNIISIVIQNFEKISAIEKFSEFINQWYDKIPEFAVNEIDNHFLTHFMTKSTGLILATCLLINNADLYEVFYTNLVIRIETSLEFDEVWNFLAVLMNYCDKDQKFRLVKLTRKKLLEIQKNVENIAKAKNFFKCLGIEPEDLY